MIVCFHKSWFFPQERKVNLTTRQIFIKSQSGYRNMLSKINTKKGQLENNQDALKSAGQSSVSIILKSEYVSCTLWSIRGNGLAWRKWMIFESRLTRLNHNDMVRSWSTYSTVRFHGFSVLWHLSMAMWGQMPKSSSRQIRSNYSVNLGWKKIVKKVVKELDLGSLVAPRPKLVGLI